VETLHTVLGLDDRRIQCTPDLMPADILGSEVLEEGEGGRRSFRFIPGPVFCQVLMADEVNRASPAPNRPCFRPCRSAASPSRPRASAARTLPCGGNPESVGAGGTYPLPEAQLDRFLMQIDIGYPDVDAERQMLIAQPA